MSQWSGPQDQGRGPATCVVCEHSYVMCWRGGGVLVEGEGRGGEGVLVGGEGRGGEWSDGERGGGAGGRRVTPLLQAKQLNSILVFLAASPDCLEEASPAVPTSHFSVC